MSEIYDEKTSIYFFSFSLIGNIAAKSVPIPVNTYDLQLKVEDPCTKSATDTLKVIILNRVCCVFFPIKCSITALILFDLVIAIIIINGLKI